MRLTQAIRRAPEMRSERPRSTDATTDLRNLITTDMQLIVNWIA